VFDSIQFILVYGFILGSIYLLISLGFTIVCGVLRVFHMGYGVVFVVSVYTTWMLMDTFHLSLFTSIVGMFILQILFTLFVIYFPVVKRYFEWEELLLTSLISAHGRFTDNDEHVLFTVNTQHHHYKLVKRINTSGIRNGYPGELELVDYPITKKDFISSGHHAWNSFFPSINIGKVQPAFCSIGLCTHSLYEAMNHAANRILYGKPVTNFAHIKKMFAESYVRLNAMKLYALRSLDYFRSASNEVRRYLLFNPIQKTKVSIEGVRVMDMILDIVAARGFEKDTL